MGTHPANEKDNCILEYVSRLFKFPSYTSLRSFITREKQDNRRNTNFVGQHVGQFCRFDWNNDN